MLPPYPLLLQLVKTSTELMKGRDSLVVPLLLILLVALRIAYNGSRDMCCGPFREMGRCVTWFGGQ